MEISVQTRSPESAPNQTGPLWGRALGTSPMCRIPCRLSRQRGHPGRKGCDNKMATMCPNTMSRPDTTAKNYSLGQATRDPAGSTQPTGWDESVVQSGQSLGERQRGRCRSRSSPDADYLREMARFRQKDLETEKWEKLLWVPCVPAILAFWHFRFIFLSLNFSVYVRAPFSRQ